MAAVEFDHLTYSYPDGHRPALKDITFHAEAGQITAILGSNGSGKSTLCLAAAGFLSALYHGEMQGKVLIQGFDSSLASPGQLAGKVGLLLQNPTNQFSRLRYTIYEEVAFGLENLGVPRVEMNDRIEAALEQVHLSALKDRSPYTLSSGQQQRLALAALLVMQPSILIMDEPTAMLDPGGSQAVYDLIRKLAGQGTTVLLTEHRLEWIACFADRVIALEEGEMILYGSPQEVMTSPKLPQAGIGWLRYTQATQSGKEQGLWPVGRPLPITLEQAAAGFQQGKDNPCAEKKRHEPPTE